MQEKAATQRLAELAAAQHGIVGAAQLRQIGISAQRASREARAGRLHRLHQGIYAVGHAAPTQYGRALAAVLACGPGALLSHESAAWLLGVSSRFPAIPEVTTTQTVRHSRREIRVHSAKTIHPLDEGESHGIPVTAVPRLLLDLAGAAAWNLRWALPRAKRLGLLDLGAVDLLLERSVGLRGVRRLRLELDRFRLPAFTRSDTELRFLQLVRDAGIPAPSMNLFIAGYEIDAYWEPLRFAVELDTYEYHGDESSFESDRVRHEDLKLAGIEMIRLTGRRIDHEPTAVTARLRQHLRRRQRELGVELPVNSL